MGSCVSIHRKHSVMNRQASFGSNNKPDDRLVIPPSPIKPKLQLINADLPVKRPNPNSLDFGSKEETFFDSQAWLESDCDDDFMSVNGDFTPSRGNTPVHHHFSSAPPQAATGDHHKSSTAPSPSPTKKRVRLSDLFKESLRINHDPDEENAKNTPESEAAGSPFVSTMDGGGSKPKREGWAVPMPGCFPSLLSSCRLVTTQQTEEGRK